jgi:hypothetical protein
LDIPNDGKHGRGSEAPMTYAFALLALALAIEPPASAGPTADRETENFLRTAQVVEIRPLRRGVTLSHLVTLSNGERTAKAVRKTIDEYMPVKHFGDGGFPELGFRDSYKSEIAAYRLDRLIELNQVPPTVARKIRGKDGSLQLWIDDCMTEGERRRKDITPPDVKHFNQQLRRVKVFFQLIQDVDYLNMSNLLIDPKFELYKIDSSRAFRTQATILDPEKPDLYSRSLLDRLRRLDPKILKQETGEWLSKRQRSALLERRDLILERVDQLIDERGEENVLYP